MNSTIPFSGLGSVVADSKTPADSIARNFFFNEPKVDDRGILVIGKRKNPIKPKNQPTIENYSENE